MSLETATFIHQLLATNPTVQDKMKQGDDHLRMLKRTLQNTFPNIQGAVSISHTTLNELPTNVSGKITTLFSARVHKGMVVMHDLANAAIPAGWSLCDGSTVPGYGTTPDCRNMFIRGWGTETYGVTGGSQNPTALAGGGHTPVIQGTALTVAQLPPHTHPNPSGARYVDTAGTSDGISGGAQAGHRNDTSLATGSTGSGEAHTHAADAVADHTHTLELPAYIRFVFIVKTTDIELP